MEGKEWRKVSAREGVTVNAAPPGGTASGHQTITAAVPGWPWSPQAHRMTDWADDEAVWQQQHRAMPPECRRWHMAQWQTAQAVRFAAVGTARQRAMFATPSRVNAPHSTASRRERSR